LLGSLPLTHIRQIIQGPARVAGVGVEDTFVQQAAHDAETPDALPLLALALRVLLDQSPNKFLSLGGYKALGDEKAGLNPRENVVRMGERHPATLLVRQLHAKSLNALERHDDALAEVDSLLPTQV
jgi:hypothetical protein